MANAACPFCRASDNSIRGEGCCNCEYSGLVPIGQSFNFKTEEEAKTFKGDISYRDIKDNRINGRPFDYNPFPDNIKATN